MSEMPDDLRRSVTRFWPPVLTVFWAWVAYESGWFQGGWLFAAFSAFCLYRTIKIWRQDRNEL